MTISRKIVHMIEGHSKPAVSSKSSNNSGVVTNLRKQPINKYIIIRETRINIPINVSHVEYLAVSAINSGDLIALFIINRCPA